MSLLDLIKSDAMVLCDGAMGTELAKKGFPEGGQENVLHPQAVTEIHRQYADAGAQLLTTNTLTMNRIYLQTHKVDVDISQVNIAGVQLARAVAQNNRFVLGDLSSSGQLLAPYGTYTEDEFTNNYTEQAGLLFNAGVDGFIIETMLDLREACCALRACKKVCSLPVFVTMSFSTLDNGGRTIMGNSVEECAKTLTQEGAAAVGANCGTLDPRQVAIIVSRFKEHTPLPIIAQPNAGQAPIDQ